MVCVNSGEHIRVVVDRQYNTVTHYLYIKVLGNNHEKATSILIT